MFWNLIIGILSFGLNLILAPKPQNAKPASLEDFDVPVAEEGLEIPEVFGTANLKAPNVVWYGDLKTKAIKGPRRYGLFGPRQTTGHQYFLGMQLVLCSGIIDELKEIWVSDKLAFEDGTTGGRIRIRAEFEGEGHFVGDVDVETGAITQIANDYLEEQFGTPIPAFRGVLTLVLRQIEIGRSPYVKPIEAKVQRIYVRPDGSDQWYSDTAAIPRSGSGLYRKISIPGTHQSFQTGGEPTADMYDGIIARISSDRRLELYDPLTGDRLYRSSVLSYDPGGLMISRPTRQIIVWDNANGDLYFYSLSNGNFQQHHSGPTPYGGTNYRKYVGFGDVKRIEDEYYLIYGVFANVICFAKDATDPDSSWVLRFNDYRGFLFGGLASHFTFNDQYIYSVHGDGHISIWTYTTLPIILAGLGPRFMAPKWSYSPDLGTLSASVLAVYVALTYIPELDQMLLIVHGGTGHIYLLSKDMQTQIDHLEIDDIEGNGIHSNYVTSNSVQVSENRIMFASGGVTSTQAIYEFTLSPLALIKRYHKSLWESPGTFSSVSSASDGKKYILLSNASLQGSKDTVYFIGADFDMNPAHIIRECITNRMGYPEADIDDDTFISAADVLYDEGFGLTFTWSREEEIGEFISMVLSHIDAYLYVSRVTGKFVLKLVRNDYDIDTIPQIDEDDVIEWSEVSRRTLADAVNSVTVKYSNREHEGEESERGKDGSHQVDNIAQMQQMANGGIPDRVMITRHYPGISTGNLAARVGERDLRSLGAGIISGRIKCKRTVESLNPGDPFRLTSARHNLEGEVMRVADIQFGDGRSNAITIKFIQDIFALGEEGLVDDSVSDWENPANPPQPLEYRLVWEAPYKQFVEYVGITQADSLLNIDSDVGIMESAGLRSTDDMIEILLSTNLNGSAYSDDEISSPAPGGLLSAEISETDTEIVLVEAEDIEELVVGSLAAINSHSRELMEIVRIDDVGISPPILTISRGVGDTIPKVHPAGSILIVFETFSDTDGDTYTAGDEVGVKLIPRTPFGELDSESTPTDTVVMDSRAVRPLPPANATLNGQGYGTLDAEGIDPIPAAWANRNRLTGATTPRDWNDATEALEASQTIEIQLLDTSFNVIHTYSGLTGTSQDIDQIDFGDRATAWVQFNSLRDGYYAWQAHRIKVLLPANLKTSGDMQDGSPISHIKLSGDAGSGREHLSGTLS